jgi:hypothetical protein
MGKSDTKIGMTRLSLCKSGIIRKWLNQPRMQGEVGVVLIEPICKEQALSILSTITCERTIQHLELLEVLLCTLVGIVA